MAQSSAAESPASDTNSAPIRRGPGWTTLLLTAIVTGALALRLWAITWALPNADRYFTYHPDEGVNLISGVLERGAFRPHLDLGFYNYGTFYFYLWQAAGAINKTYGLISLPSSDSPGTPSPESIASLILIGRLLTAVMGALTVAAVFALGSRLYGRGAGLAAAFVAAIIPIAAIHGHFATVDVPATLFVTLALVLGARLLRSDRPIDGALAGALCGIAAATKYNAGLVIVAPLAAALALNEQRTSNFKQGAAILTGAVACFLLACPGPLINPSKFWGDFTYEVEKSRTGMGLLFADTGIGWVYHVTSSLRFGLGGPLLLLAVVAIGIAAWKHKRQDFYLLTFFLLYYLVIGAAQVRFMRYIIPLCPVIAVLVGRLLADEWSANRGLLTATRGAAEALILASLWVSFALTRLMTLPDARDQALAFIRERIPEGRVLAFARLPWYDVPPLSPVFTAPDPRARREAALTPGRYTIRIPAEDRELDASVMAPPLPDSVILSDIATQDWERLATPGWKQFKDSLQTYTPNVFENLPSAAGIKLGKPGHVPNDLLYIYPRITVYTRRP